MRTQVSLLLVLLLAGCSSAKTDYYTLSAVPPARAAPAGRPLHPPLEVGDVSIPATIDRNEIVLVAPNDRLELVGTSVWGAPLDQLIRRALSDDLAERLPPNSVLPPGTPEPKGGLRIVAVSIERFDGDTAGDVRLRAAWTLARSGQTPSGTPHRERIDVNAGVGATAAVVPAMSRALGVLADRIAAAVS